MVKNEIQEKRMREYFLDSAKNMIRAEGIRSVSVRNVAESAGYSYATLYNYFTDIKELMFLCIKDFNEECRVYVDSQKHPEELSLERLLSKVKSYFNFYVQYTGIYELMFVAEMPHVKSSDVKNLFDEIVMDDFNKLCEGLSKQEKQVKLDLLRASVHGMLQFYLMRRMPEDYMEFITRAMNAVAIVFKK